VTDRQSVYQSRLKSYFGRFNYNYKEKYLLEANIRRDASAPAFSPENIWGTFPSFSAGWRISKEHFMDDVSWISNLKLRASIGTLGSDNIGSYIYSKTYTSQFSTYTFDENGQVKVAGFYISRFPNAEVKWEEVHISNIGLDVELWGGRLGFAIDYYIKDTEDLLYGVPIPASVGISTHNFDAVNPEVNIGTMRNTGIDLDVVYREQFGMFRLTANGNTSFMKNEVLSLNGDDYITGGSGGGQIGGMTRTQAGMPISSFYGFRVQQMLNSANDIFAINSYSPDGIYQEAGTGPGDLMYVDISGPDGVPDGKVTWEHDRTFIGNPWPKIIYALNLNLQYKQSFDIMLQFQGVQGVDIFNANKAYTRNFFGDSNTSTDIYEAWTPENHTNNPRNIASDPNGNFSRPSTYFIEDGSYLKLRNAQIGYNFSDNLLKKLGGIEGIRLYLNASNVFTITSYTGADPELAGSNISRGVDYGLYPHTRTFGGGLDIQF
jgi:TonB-linked SusC/RagA family outer membrane protein